MDQLDDIFYRRSQQSLPRGEGLGCFVAGTPVWTPDGFRAIEDIKQGDEVYCFDSHENIHVRRVTQAHVHPNQRVWRYHVWGTNFTATPNHAFLTDRGGFREICRFNPGDLLLDSRWEYRTFLRKEEVGSAIVYNFEVEEFHCYFVTEWAIAAHNGGGGKKAAGSGEELSDSGSSNSKVTVVELLGEGPIQGLKLGNRSIYLDDTPVERAGGQKNFTGFKRKVRRGNPSQKLMKGYSDVQASEVSVSVEVKKNSPITRSFVNPQVDSVKIRLSVQLQKYEDDGDIVGNSVQFQIHIKQGGSGFELRLDKTIKGKYSSPVEFEYTFDLDTLGGTRDSFQIRVTKVSDDSSSQQVTRNLRWQSFTEQIEAKLNFPYSAVIGMQFNIEQFSSVPRRSYRIGGRTVKIPSNAVVGNDGGLNFTGNWDGTFITPALATSDPAWQVYDLLTNPRYGLGKLISEAQIDKWSLYAISAYNNQRVPNGFGADHRRYTCNVLLQSKEDAAKYIESILGACNAFYYWGGDKIYFWQDRPAPVVGGRDWTWQFSNADVVDGVFKYSSIDVKSRQSIVNVFWNDPADFMRQTVEPVELQAAVDAYGFRDTEWTAYGCTDRGEAYRKGRHYLYTNFLETETVNFKARAFGIYCRPGDVIAIADWRKAAARYGGIISASTATVITLDSPVFLPTATGYSITVMLDDLTLETRTIANGAGTHSTITATAPFSQQPKVQGNWFVDVIQPQKFRVLRMRAEAGSPGAVEIVAGTYRADKYDAIELGFALRQIQTRITVPVEINSPRDVRLSFISSYDNSLGDYTFKIIATWLRPLDDAGAEDLFITSYTVEYKRGVDGVWQGTQTTLSQEARWTVTQRGIYYVRVSAVNIGGVTSPFIESALLNIGTYNLNLNYALQPCAIAKFITQI